MTITEAKTSMLSDHQCVSAIDRSWELGVLLIAWSVVVVRKMFSRNVRAMHCLIHKYDRLMKISNIKLSSIGLRHVARSFSVTDCCVLQGRLCTRLEVFFDVLD